MNVDKSIISVEKAARNFELAGETVSVLKSIDLNVEPGEFVTLIGRSGSGKVSLWVKEPIRVGTVICILLFL